MKTASGWLRTLGEPALLEGWDIGEACDIEDLHDCIVDAGENHIPLFVHGLLGGQQNPQPCGGKVFHGGKIKHQLLDARDGFLEG